jgi:aromatic-L-amino-acid/L-tryptophan decarboxylase
LRAQLPAAPPETAEPMEAIFADFERLVVPGMTHWQHPRFFAYFPANATPPSMLAEFLASIMAAQCMLWQTSPAATEMEGVMMDWLRRALGLPEGFRGVIQDSASSATLAAVLTMRERALDWAGNRAGLSGQPPAADLCVIRGAFLDRPRRSGSPGSGREPDPHSDGRPRFGAWTRRAGAAIGPTARRGICRPG